MPGRAIGDLRAARQRSRRHTRGRLRSTRRRRKQSIYLGATVSVNRLLCWSAHPRATLWLRTEDRAVTAAPTDILNALVGGRCHR
jgi:hypothetical protein